MAMKMPNDLCVDEGFDLCGALRRIRRIADLSQRDLASAAAISPSTLAHAEAGTRDLPVQSLARVCALVGLRIALLDENGDPVEGMAENGVRDRLGRRFPAHLDTRYSDEGWWHGPERYSRPVPWYTFDRDRERRDSRRSTRGTPSDHQLPQRGDSPAERTAARRQDARRRRIEELERRRRAGEVQPVELFVCSCAPECDGLDDRSGPPVHAPGCPCGCDIC
jgi:transcriptional regulator with XRE-family HTH domain